jgi:hypothetical protein
VYSNLKTVQNCDTGKKKIKEVTIKNSDCECKNRALRQDDLGNTVYECLKFGNVCLPNTKLNLPKCDIEIQFTQKGKGAQ